MEGNTEQMLMCWCLPEGCLLVTRASRMWQPHEQMPLGCPVVSPCPTPALYGHTMQTSQKLCAFSTPLTSRSLSCLECAMETTNS